MTMNATPRNPIAVRVGTRIRQARNHTGMSQERFARSIGTDRHSIMRWESGKNLPQAHNLQRIAEATGHRAEWFFTGGDDDEEEARAERLAAVKLRVGNELAQLLEMLAADRPAAF